MGPNFERRHGNFNAPGMHFLHVFCDHSSPLQHETEEKLRQAEHLAQQKEIEQRRENELQKVALNLREEQFTKSLTEIKDCFEKGKAMFHSDLQQMEKLVKKFRKSRRKFKTAQLTLLNQKDLEFEDMLSSDPDEADPGPNAPKEEQKDGFEPTPKENDLGDDDENECNMPMIRMGLGGVPLKENGEPLELTASAKWGSEYDDTNSLVLFLRFFRGKKII